MRKLPTLAATAAAQKQLDAAKAIRAEARASVEAIKATNDRKIAAVREAIQPAIDNAGEMAGTGSGDKAIATLDASFASQEFGGRSREVDLLTKISDSSNRTAERLERMTFEGIPGS